MWGVVVQISVCAATLFFRKQTVVMDRPPIYLDYNATTPIDPAVVEAMLPYFREHFGNPSSVHAYGKAARDAVERARGQLAALIGALPEEIVFTGGGSEASNHAIKGAVLGSRRGWRGGPHVVTSEIEHPATLRPCGFLRSMGYTPVAVPVDRYGSVDPDDIRLAIGRRTRLVTIMHSNNEVGTLQPIREIAQISHSRGILVHTDAAQSVGKVPINVRELDVDLMTIAGHKMYAPKGIGALFIRRGVSLGRLIHGADHESGRRAGTENVALMVALGEAAAIAQRELPESGSKLRSLRDRLFALLHQKLGDTVVRNGHPEHGLPNTLNVNFVGQIGAELLAHTPEIAASTGSACHAGEISLSPVLKAMGIPCDMGMGAVRLSVGRLTTEAEIDEAAKALIRAVTSPR